MLAAAGLAIAGCSGSAGHPASGRPTGSAMRGQGTSCSHPTATAATYIPTPEGSVSPPRVGPITFSPGPFQLPHPDKVLISRVSASQKGSLTLTGYNCRDNRILRFWYRNTTVLPEPLNRRPNEGDRIAVLPYFPHTDYPGYMLFTELGQWNIIVSHGTAVLGNIVITVAPGSGPESP